MWFRPTGLRAGSHGSWDSVLPGRLGDSGYVLPDDWHFRGIAWVVGDVCIPQREREEAHNYKPHLTNALRKRDQGPIIRCWLEHTVNSFASFEIFRTEIQTLGRPRDVALACLKPCYTWASLLVREFERRGHAKRFCSSHNHTAAEGFSPHSTGCHVQRRSHPGPKKRQGPEPEAKVRTSSWISPSDST